MVEKLLEDMKSAMKEQDKEKLATIRMAKAAIDKEHIDNKKDINDTLLIDVISKEIKTRKESLKEFEKGNRSDLVEKTNREIDILKVYLPEALSEVEVDEIIDEAFVDIEPKSMRDMGKVMAFVTPKVKGRFDMSIISSKIKTRLDD